MKRQPYRIEHGIPLPPHGGRQGRPHSALTLAIKALKKGESMFVADRARATVGKAARVYLGKGNYETHTEQENGRTGVRVWRVK